MRRAQILYQIETHATHAPALYVAHSAFVPLALSKTLRICLSHSDATQWWTVIVPRGQWFGHELDRDWPGRRTNLLGRGAMGGFWRRRICVWTSQIYVEIYGGLCKPQEGPSERPEVLCHLRRVGGVFLDHPGGSETHLVKEVTARFGINRRRHNRSRWVNLFIFLKGSVNGVNNSSVNCFSFNPHQKPKQQKGGPRW